MIMSVNRPAEPWLSFLTQLDAQLTEPADFHCMGGFVVSQCYGFTRETRDIDVLTVIPVQVVDRVIKLAGKHSALHTRYGVYVHRFAIVNYPADYEQRLTRVFPVWPNVRLWALEPHDLALTKLERSDDVDVRDVIYLAQAGLINRETLINRFETEWDPYVVGRTPTWHQTTLSVWIESCWPE